MDPFPPSPCDSLDGIEDLDAYLEAKGSLSHFPTPPPKKKSLVGIAEVKAEQEVDDQYLHIATVIADAAGVDIYPTPDDIEMIRQMFARTLPEAAISAIALNILSELQCREAGLGRYTCFPPDLVTVAALSLAVSIAEDHPPTTRWWAWTACHGTWSCGRIDLTVRKVLASLDFRLHPLSDSDRLDYAYARLSRGTTGHLTRFQDFRAHGKTVVLQESELWGEAHLERNLASASGTKLQNERPAPTTTEWHLELLVKGTSSMWDHGQLTPTASGPPDENPELLPAP